MAQYSVVVGLSVNALQGGEIDPADFEAHLDEVLGELERLDVDDADYAGSLRKGHIEFMVFVEADSLSDAQAQADAAVRSAIHAAGGQTANWTGEFSQRSSSAEVMDSPSKADLIEA